MIDQIKTVADLLAEYVLYLAFPAIFAPFLVVALVLKTYPTVRAVLFFTVPSLAAVVNFIAQGPVVIASVAIVADVVVLCIMGVDLISVVKVGKKIAVERKAESITSLGQPQDVQIILTNNDDKPVHVEFVDDSTPFSIVVPPRATDDLLEEEKEDYAAHAKSTAFFDRRDLPPQSQETVNYRILWTQRGVFSLEFVALRLVSHGRLWAKYQKKPTLTVFQVFPNFCQLTQLGLFARKSRLSILGVRRARRIGQDAEFERLRDYTLDDQYKFLDWKATARLNKLIVRDFQTTRNQRIILALDAGRMTMNLSRGITLFDFALNSALALAYIALKQGDEVGFLVFSNEVKRYVPPCGGVSHMNSLIRSVFDVFPERVESRYDRAFSYLKTHSQKRALVVLATNVLDERNATQIEACMTNLLGSHLPLGLFLREHSLFDAVDQYDELERIIRSSSKEETSPKDRRIANRLSLVAEQYRARDPADEIEAMLWNSDVEEKPAPEDLFFRAGAASEILNWRRKTLANLEAKGVLALDVFPEDATAPLINKYLEIKARRML